MLSVCQFELTEHHRLLHLHCDISEYVGYILKDVFDSLEHLYLSVSFVLHLSFQSVHLCGNSDLQAFGMEGATALYLSTSMIY